MYIGNHAGFESWQIKTILGGLQDPSVNVIILGKVASFKGISRPNVFYATEKKVSPFHLMATFPISVIVSYCDHFIVENSLYYQIPIVCIPSLKNKRWIDLLTEKKLGISFPEGFWTESTVRDVVKQISTLHPYYLQKTEWNQMLNILEYQGSVYHQEEDYHIESYLNHILL